MSKFNIIIPHYGIQHLTTLCLRCLRSIRECSKNYRLIFIDNASPEFDIVKPELDLHPHLLVRNSENLGFIKAVNIGLKLATAPYIVLLNNDTKVERDWLEVLVEPLRQNAAHISGPLSTTPASWQGRWPQRAGWDILPRPSMLAFFCTMFKKEVFDKVGYLDEDFGPGFGDDDWFCHQAQNLGFKLALVRSLKITHEHRSTFNHIYGKTAVVTMQEKALDLFKKKCNA